MQNININVGIRRAQSVTISVVPEHIFVFREKEKDTRVLRFYLRRICNTSCPSRESLGFAGCRREKTNKNESNLSQNLDFINLIV